MKINDYLSDVAYRLCIESHTQEYPFGGIIHGPKMTRETNDIQFVLESSIGMHKWP